MADDTVQTRVTLYHETRGSHVHVDVFVARGRMADHVAGGRAGNLVVRVEEWGSFLRYIHMEPTCAYWAMSFGDFMVQILPEAARR